MQKSLLNVLKSIKVHMQDDYCKANQMHTRMHIYIQGTHVDYTSSYSHIYEVPLYSEMIADRWKVNTSIISYIYFFMWQELWKSVLANLRKECSMTHSTACAMKLAFRFILHNQLYTLWPMTFQSLAPPLPLLTNSVLFLCILFLAHENAVFSFCVCVISPNINSRHIHCLQMKDFFLFKTPLYVSVHLIMDNWVVPVSWLLGIMP